MIFKILCPIHGTRYVERQGTFEAEKGNFELLLIELKTRRLNLAEMEFLLNENSLKREKKEATKISV